jgi:hypothetical protein
MKCAYSICIMLELYNDTVPTSKCIWESAWMQYFLGINDQNILYFPIVRCAWCVSIILWQKIKQNCSWISNEKGWDVQVYMANVNR